MIHLKDVAAKEFGRPVLMCADIDRETGLITVWVKRRKKSFTIPLGLVLTIVYERGVKAEVVAKKAEKKARRRKGGAE